MTGGLGYIGSHTVVEILSAQKDRVIIVDNLDNSNVNCLQRLRQLTNADEETLKFFEIDILDEAALEKTVFSKFKIESVIHFAGLKAVGESIEKPLDYY